MGTRFTHRVKARYGDCDMQGVVYNPNYFVYLDDAMDTWIQSELGPDYLGRFDYVVKKASLEWEAPARWRDVVEMRPEVTRWGRTSFDVSVALSVDGRRIGVAEFVFISVEPGSHEPKPVPIPEEVRNALSV
ncbi:acyl-CoA thioesterase [Actinomadura sp. SCN-SB]|uniref:acyl-CoA thioesterase n=1 Tax=Actinomadura sp. SCN-SB TaxID=3373092 RepID=UPI0037538966